jgi:multidrug transporter EmrE-like cation transporter
LIYLLIFLQVLLQSVAQVILKCGANEAVRTSVPWFSLAGLWQIFTTPIIVLGVFVMWMGSYISLYLLGNTSLFWISSVTLSLHILMVSLAGRFFFGEVLTPINIFGIALIIMGVIFVSQKA